MMRRFLAAVLIMAVGLLVAQLVRRWLGGRIDRIGADPLIKRFLLRAAWLIIIGVAALSALSQAGLDTSSLLAGLGVTSIIIGFALKDTLSNFAAGLMLIIYRPFRAGDLVSIEGVLGTIEELTIVNVQMITTDGIRVIMPNSKVWGAVIFNYSLSRSRRLEFKLRVSDQDAHRALVVLREALSSDPRVLGNPAPSVIITALADGAAELIARAWTNPQDFQSAQSELYLQLRQALERAQIPTK